MDEDTVSTRAAAPDPRSARTLDPDMVATTAPAATDAPLDATRISIDQATGALGRERTLLVKPRGSDLKIPSDLLGLTPIEYDGSVAPEDLETVLGPVCSDIRKTLKRLGPK